VSRLTIVLLLNLALITALVIVGLTAHSIGVLAEGADYLADAAAICISLLAIWLSHRSPTTRRPLGYRNATKVAALVNGGWLLLLSILVALGAALRLVNHTSHVTGLPVLVVSGIAASLMLIGALILRGADADDDDGDGGLNMRAVLLDTAADAATAAGVALTGAVIYATNGWYWLDPAVALVIAVIVGYHALALVREVVAALRDARPASCTREVR
jgi:cobalt-zinc-cadmium efflux system protein